MAEGNEVQDVASLVQQAKQAVKEIEDPQMKLMAFGEILRFLLGHQAQPTERTTRRKTRKAGAVSKAQTSTKSKGTMAWLEELKQEGFFEKPKNTSETLSRLEERGHHLQTSDLTWPLKELATRKILRRKKMELGEGGKQVWHYSNW
jgi:hypothetical protein